jgi:isocitrate dehydrogenase
MIKKIKMQKITVAKGDGIGPEIIESTLKILLAAGAQIEPEFIEIGEKVYLAGNTSGISTESWDTIRKNKVFLKGPISTPSGGGYKSLNVSCRKFLGLFANVRPSRSYYPVINTAHKKMDLVIIRENEEDLYAGVEHQQTDECVQCLKLITRPGSEKIIRYAFEFAKQRGRKKVHCFTKDNIMKQTDGLFHQVFREISQEYPEIESKHMIIDIGAARLATHPEEFDVIVTLNLYGDIISDIAADISGSVGLGASSNIGDEVAMFEAVHGSAPDIAGQGIANPSGILGAACMMLDHLGQSEISQKIRAALLATLESGEVTKDIHLNFFSGLPMIMREGPLSTEDFTDAVIRNLGNKPKSLVLDVSGFSPIVMKKYQRAPKKNKELVGCDIFVHWRGSDPEELARVGKLVEGNNLQLLMITNRGIKVWPDGFKETHLVDHWRMRFLSNEFTCTSSEIREILSKIESIGFTGTELKDYQKLDWIKLENLYNFDGQRGFSLIQGQ